MTEFTRIPKMGGRLRPYEQLVIIAIALADSDVVTYEEIAHHAGMSFSQAVKVVKSLKERGLISVTKQGNANQYKINEDAILSIPQREGRFK